MLSERLEIWALAGYLEQCILGFRKLVMMLGSEKLLDPGSKGKSYSVPPTRVGIELEMEESKMKYRSICDSFLDSMIRLTVWGY